MCLQTLRELTLHNFDDVPPLPAPDLFPNPESLFHYVPAPPAWLGALPRLAHLQRAGLAIAQHPPPAAAGAGALSAGARALAFPRLPGLTCLHLRLGAGVSSVTVPLAGMPALRELRFYSQEGVWDGTTADLVAGGAALQLTRLTLFLRSAVVDFSLLPALQALAVGADELSADGTDQPQAGEPPGRVAGAALRA